MPDRFVSSTERTLRPGRQALLPTILFADADANYRAMARESIEQYSRRPPDDQVLDKLLERVRYVPGSFAIAGRSIRNGIVSPSISASRVASSSAAFSACSRVNSLR